MGKIGRALSAAVEPDTVARAARLAFVVAPVLVLINQGDVILAGNEPDWSKVVLTFLVPYCVSTWTSVSLNMAASN